MTVVEKVAYIKGLCEGLALDESVSGECGNTAKIN